MAVVQGETIDEGPGLSSAIAVGEAIADEPASLHRGAKPVGSLKSVVAGVVAGLLAGIVAVTNAVSYATLVYGGDLAVHVADGINAGLFSAAVAGLILALRSTYSGTIGIPQHVTAAVLGIMAASVAARMGPGAGAESVAATVLVMIALSNAICGLTFLTLGALSLGRVIRYIPFPVVGGVMAGVGTLLVRGAISMLTGESFSIATVPDLFTSDVAAMWAPAAVLGVVLWVLTRRFSQAWLLPAVLSAAAAIFFLVLFVTDTTLSEAREAGWLLGSFTSDRPLLPIDLQMLEAVEWTVLPGEAMNLGSLVVVATVTMLLFASALDVAVRHDIDVNRELRATGLANLLASFGGGLPSFHSLSLSVTASRMKVPPRVVSLTSALVCVFVLVFGSAALAYVPKPILGGLLIYFGLGFLVEWLYASAFRLPRADYLVILLIVAVFTLVGYLKGIAVGVAAGIVLFVIRYSRITIVRHALSGLDLHGKLDRTEEAREILRTTAGAIAIFKLQGYIFFATAHRVLDRLRQRLDDPLQPALRYLILDFRRVSGLDASAVFSFEKMVRYAEERHYRIVLAKMSDDVASQLQRAGILKHASERVQVFPGLYRGLEWCENRILSTSRGSDIGIDGDIGSREVLKRRLIDAFDNEAGMQKFCAYLERRSVATGTYIIRQRDRSRDLFLVESGQVTVRLEAKPGEEGTRLHTFGPGAVVGEVALYLGKERSASVIADRDSDILVLTVPALARMKEDDPELAASFHEFIARLLADRLTDTSRLVTALLD